MGSAKQLLLTSLAGCSVLPVWQQWSHHWSCSLQSHGRTTQSSSSSVVPQTIASITGGRSHIAVSFVTGQSTLNSLWGPCLCGHLTCGLMPCGMPASTRERSFSERGRETAILSHVRSPTSWLWVNSRWACHRSLCGGSSTRGAPAIWLHPGSEPSTKREEKGRETCSLLPTLVWSV